MESTLLKCDRSNIVQVLTERFGAGAPGSGLTLSSHEAHVLIEMLHTPCAVCASAVPDRSDNLRATLGGIQDLAILILLATTILEDPPTSTPDDPGRPLAATGGRS